MITSILLVVLFIAAISLSVLVLIQNKSGDMGTAFGGGSSNSLFGARGSGDFLSRATSVVAIAFFASALGLAYIYSKQGRQVSESVIQQAQQSEATEKPGDLITTPEQVQENTPTDSDLPTVPE